MQHNDIFNHRLQPWSLVRASAAVSFGICRMCCPFLKRGARVVVVLEPTRVSARKEKYSMSNATRVSSVSRSVKSSPIAAKLVYRVVECNYVSQVEGCESIPDNTNATSLIESHVNAAAAMRQRDELNAALEQFGESDFRRVIVVVDWAD
jgi:hypothetical protein